MAERTQVGIVGAGPAGLLLAHLLHRAGIESVVLERRSREHIESRVRAGVLEPGAAELLRGAGLGERLDREGLVHRGIHLQFEGERHHLDFTELAGRGILVYGQQEVVKDLVAARVAAGAGPVFEAEATALSGLGSRPVIAYRHQGRERELACDFIAGCDGSHGVARAALPAGAAQVYERAYPHAWLGILAQTPPAAEELVYAHHERGFALQSMRSPEISRLYLQVAVDEAPAAWPPPRIWEELRLRLGEPGLRAGEILESGITPMRALVVEPMRHGRLFLAGDAAHVVPPTGAKGMNLALADVALLAAGLAQWYGEGSAAGLDGYAGGCRRRAWRAQHFSNFMTDLLHRDPAGDPYLHQLRVAHLRNLVESRSAAAALAENYTSAATASQVFPRHAP